MGERSKILSLPEATRNELDAKLIGGGFADYVALEAWLRAQGFEVGKSSIQRYGSKLEERIAQLKRATDQAKALVEASPDSDASMARGLMRLYQSKLWDVLYELELDPDTIDLNKVGKLLAPLVRAEVHLNKFAAEVREKTTAVVGELVEAQGMSEEQAEFWMRKFLGVVPS